MKYITLHIRTDNLTREDLIKGLNLRILRVINHKTSLSEFNVIGKVTISQCLSFYD